MNSGNLRKLGMLNRSRIRPSAMSAFLFELRVFVSMTLLSIPVGEAHLAVRKLPR